MRSSSNVPPSLCAAVQQIEGVVLKMADGDIKLVWRSQVNELQTALQVLPLFQFASIPGNVYRRGGPALLEENR